MNDAVDDVVTAVGDTYEATADGASHLWDKVVDMGKQCIDDCATTAKCGFHFFQRYHPLSFATRLVYGDECNRPGCKGLLDMLIRVVRPRDPNDIVGPPGTGPSRWIPLSTTITYRIRFENRADATADANRIFVVHPIDPHVDLTSFRLTGFGFRDLDWDIPKNQAVFQQRIQLGQDFGGIYVDITAGLDVQNRRAIWILQAIDPATGAAPQNVSTGVLPPNPENGTQRHLCLNN